MPVLKAQDFGGQARQPIDCGCGSPAIVGPVVQGQSLIPEVDVCAQDDPQNSPIGEDPYHCSLGVTFQPTMDRVRRIVHEMGLRPYRVFLVWRERDQNRNWIETCKGELMPVELVHLNNMQVVTEVWGSDLSGGVMLRKISPQQVTHDILRGFMQNEDWAGENEDREFFYEIQLMTRCEGQLSNRPFRFYPATEPTFDAESYQFMINLDEQKGRRGRDFSDQTIGTMKIDGRPLDPKPVSGRPRLVTS